MSSNIFQTKQGDTSPITIPFLQGNGSYVDFTGATATTFSMRLAGTNAYIVTDGSCTLVSQTINGVTFQTPRYAFADADVATPGDYEAEIHAVLGGAKIRFPHDRANPFVIVSIQADLT